MLCAPGEPGNIDGHLASNTYNMFHLCLHAEGDFPHLPQVLRFKSVSSMMMIDDMRILFKTAEGQFLNAQNKRGAMAISPA